MRNDEAGPAQDRPASNLTQRQDSGRVVTGAAVLASASTLTVAGVVVAGIPRPRLVMPNAERDRARQRRAVARRHARFVRWLDDLLRNRQPAPGDQLGVPVDYDATGLSMGVPEREAAGRLWWYRERAKRGGAA